MNKGKAIKKVYTPKQIFIKKFMKNKLAVAGSIVIVVFVIMSVCAPLFAKYEPNATDLLNIRSAPDHTHILGTDDLGRDIFSRLLYGGRVSIAVGVASMMLQIIIGVTIGVIAGYFGGIVDKIIMRIVDIIMCFPFFVIAIALAAVIGGSITNLVLIIGMLMWPVITRIVRGEVLVTKQNEYILAAKALGFNTFEIIVHDIIPNIISAILVSSTLCIAQGILMEATLSFLGLGVNPPTPSWGNMLVAAQNMSVLSHKWWMWIPAGMAVVLIVLSVNFVGDGLRDALDVETNV